MMSETLEDRQAWPPDELVSELSIAAKPGARSSRRAA